MKQQSINFLKSTVLIGLTSLLVGVGVVKAQRNAEKTIIRDSSGKQVILYEQSHALVIWAGNYQRGWSKLNNVENEAKRVSAALERRGFKVTQVGDPNGEELQDAIKNFIDTYGYQTDNRLVIFFAGHGHTRQRTKGYLVPVDAPDPRTSEANKQKFLSLALPMQLVNTWARLAEAKHVLFVFDSCFSGTVFKQRSAPTPNRYILDVMAKPVRQFLTAGDADEKVPAKSIFTPLFIRALDGDADANQDGYVTGDELGLYLRQNLKEYDTQQTPQFGTIRDPDLDQGDIVFRSLVQQPIAAPLPSPSPEPSFRPIKPPPSRALPSPSPSPSIAASTTPKPTPSPSLRRPETNLISKTTGVDYTRLRDLLNEEKWKEADLETEKVMLQAVKREEEWLGEEDIENFSCEDLLTIDQLWVSASGGKFGFSVQKEIWKNSGSPSPSAPLETWRKFYIAIGWKTEESGTQSWRGYVAQDDLMGFRSISRALPGNLPRAPFSSIPGVWVGGDSWVDLVTEQMGILFYRTIVCKL